MGKGKKKFTTVEEASTKAKSFGTVAKQTKQDEKVTHVKDESVEEVSPSNEIIDKIVDPALDTVKDELDIKADDKLQTVTSEPIPLSMGKNTNTVPDKVLVHPDSVQYSETIPCPRKDPIQRLHWIPYNNQKHLL